jgi:hypothetical protein
LFIPFGNKGNVRQVESGREGTCQKPRTAFLKNLLTAKWPKVLKKSGIKSIRTRTLVWLHRKKCLSELIDCKRSKEVNVIFC